MSARPLRAACTCPSGGFHLDSPVTFTVFPGTPGIVDLLLFEEEPSKVPAGKLARPAQSGMHMQMGPLMAAGEEWLRTELHPSRLARTTIQKIGKLLFLFRDNSITEVSCTGQTKDRAGGRFKTRRAQPQAAPPERGAPPRWAYGERHAAPSSASPSSAISPSVRGRAFFGFASFPSLSAPSALGSKPRALKASSSNG